MKKFLTTVLVIIVAVSLGFGVFYLVRDNEVISLKTASLYKNVNEKFELGLDLEDPNSYTKVEVYSTDEKVIEVTNKDIKIIGKTAVGEFKALQGGVAKIVFKTNNAKFRNVSCDVIVCDGSQSYPFRISTPQDLANIGKTELYSINACYELTNNIDIGKMIDLNTNASWAPIGFVNNTVTPFNGRLDGKGYTIENLKLSATTQSTGLFSKLSSTAKVYNVKFDGVTMLVSGNTAVNAGTVAGENYGTVERVEVKNANIVSTNPNAVVGGVVGANLSVNNGRTQTIAKLDRVSASVTAGGKLDKGVSSESVQGTFGGVAGKNYGGRVYFSYATGKIDTSAAEKITLVGGLIGENKFAKIDSDGINKNYTKSLGASIQECYTNVNITNKIDNKVGYVIGQTVDTTAENALNVISGNYYISTVEGISGVANRTGNTGTETSRKFEAMLSTEAEGNGGNLKDLSSLKSAMVGTKEYVKDGDGYKLIEKDGTIYYWNTNVWEIRVGENSGYPVLNMAEQNVLPSLDSNNGEIKKITNAQELKDALTEDGLLDKIILVDGDIDFQNIPWTPIGTEEKPFEGKLYVLNGVFKNIVVSGTHKYAGIFGYVGKNAVIEGVKVENAQVVGEYAGIIAGYNDGTILNFEIGGEQKCVVKAKVAGGAVAGYNNGRILGFFSDKTYHITNVSVNSVVNNVSIVGSADKVELGGVAGHNAKDAIITGNDDYIKLQNVSVTPEVDFSNLYVGGVTGYNEGTISYVMVGTAEKQFTAVTNEKKGNASIGGAAGYTFGPIRKVWVMVNITASTSEGNFVGGIAGQALFDSNTKRIEECKVSNSSLSGHKVGGAVATLNVTYEYTINADDGSGVWEQIGNFFKGITYEERTTLRSVKTGEDDVVNIDMFEITNTTLGGKYTAGAICDHNGGVARNMYISATMSGSKNSGIVNDSSYDRQTKQGGVIYNVVALSKFTSGKSYTTSADATIHKQPDINKRECGFVVNYHCQSTSGAEDQTFCGVFWSRALNSKDMKKASSWEFLKGNSAWNVRDNEIPTLNF